MEKQNKQPEEVYVTMASFIDDQLVQRVFALFSLLINNNVKTVHLLMQSTGGHVPAGIALYNFLKNIPVNIITYNGGNVASIAVIVYLAGKIRNVSENASFMIHKTSFQFPAPVMAEILEICANNIKRDDANTEAIWKKYITMKDEKWGILKTTDLIIRPEEAVAIGLSHAMGDFALPTGNKLFDVSFKH